MFRTLLLLGTAVLTVPLCAQRVVPVGVGATNDVADMAVWNGQLVVVGENFMALLGVNGTGVQGWDGTQVFSFPAVFNASSFGYREVEELNGELYIGGRISDLGNVARWDGAAWVALDQGLPDDVSSLCVHDGALHAATMNGLVCRWTGAAWDTLGGPFDSSIRALTSHQGVLYAGGFFTLNWEGGPVSHLARWTGITWEQVGSGLTGSVWDLVSTPDGLVIGGTFTADVGGAPLPGWAIWNGSSYGVPPLAPLPQYIYGAFERRMAVLPDGSYVVGGYRISGDEAFDLDYRTSCAAEFGGRLFLGGFEGVPFTGHGRTNRFSELIDGVHHTVVDAGAMRATVTPTPALFDRHWMNLHGLEVPKDSGVYSIYTASPWLIGKQQDEWKRTSPSYNNITSDDSLLWAGPQQALVRDNDFYRRYHQVWTVDQATIDAHAAQWNEPGYVMPYAIATWPGNGNTANGEPARLAPFQDQDGDDLYEPEAGDHPLIRGHRAAYTLLHSDRYPAYADDVECDMHVLVYNYDDPTQEDRYNSTFINLRMINRSGADYDSVFFGLFTDLDVGGYNDDLSECDSTRSLWLSYNGDELDADTVQGSNPIMGYGTQPPAIGVKYLNHPLYAHSTWQSDEAPIFVEEYIDLLLGSPDGVPHVGPGFSSRYQFPGGSWSDTFVGGDAVADRRSVGSTGPFTWAADDTLCMDLAVIHARAPEGGAYASVVALKQRADAVQALYDAMAYTCTRFDNVVGVNEVVPEEWSAYPSPTADRVTVRGPAPRTDLRVTVLDAMGRTVHTSTWPAGRSTVDLDLTNVEDGAYLVVLNGADVQRTLRVIKGR
ncbi:MAG: T9SS type A sorting domain-containing protein [Flavobacteriales bacterium]|nr:T9SS type A sorting domain-containing protein [Flavobacteriales bacterium]